MNKVIKVRAKKKVAARSTRFGWTHCVACRNRKRYRSPDILCRTCRRLFDIGNSQVGFTVNEMYKFLEWARIRDNVEAWLNMESRYT